MSSDEERAPQPGMTPEDPETPEEVDEDRRGR